MCKSPRLVMKKQVKYSIKIGRSYLQLTLRMGSKAREKKKHGEYDWYKQAVHVLVHGEIMYVYSRVGSLRRYPRQGFVLIYSHQLEEDTNTRQRMKA
jgi:hypothetical protein